MTGIPSHMEVSNLKSLRIACCALAVWIVAPDAGAQPSDPAQIAQHCIQHVSAVAAHRIQRNQAIAGECVAKIEHLVEAGHIGAARHMAVICAHRIMAGTNQALQHIHARCTECTQVLLSLGAPRLAQAVREVCMQRAQAMNASRHAALQAIRDALPGDEPLPAAVCPPDLDGDGDVGVADLALLIAALGTAVTGAPDLDGDGAVTVTDVVELVIGWGPCG